MTSQHPHAHHLAGQTIILPHHPDDPDSQPVEYDVEDWADRLGLSWMDATGNPAAMKYALRTGTGHTLHGGRVPIDNEVVYGKVDWAGHLLHADEIAQAALLHGDEIADAERGRGAA